MQNRLQEFYQGLDLQYAQGDLGEVEKFLITSAIRAQKSGQSGMEEQIAVYNELGSFYRGAGRYALSLDAFERARTLAAGAVGENCSQYATILNNMAGTYRLMKDYDHAIPRFLEAIRIYREEGRQKSYAYASVLNNLALAYQEPRQSDKAIAYLEQALVLIEKMPGHRHEVAVTYNNLTSLYYAAGNPKLAMLCLNRALLEFEKCSDEENVHYAAGLNSLAGFLYAEGECERALRLYRKSAEYTKRFFGENVEFAITCQNMCWVYKKMGKWDKAIAVLGKAEKVYQKLLDPEHERTRAVADDLQRLHEARGA